MCDYATRQRHDAMQPADRAHPSYPSPKHARAKQYCITVFRSDIKRYLWTTKWCLKNGLFDRDFVQKLQLIDIFGCLSKHDMTSSNSSVIFYVNREKIHLGNNVINSKKKRDVQKNRQKCSKTKNIGHRFLHFVFIFDDFWLYLPTRSPL